MQKIDACVISFNETHVLCEMSYNHYEMTFPISYFDEMKLYAGKPLTITFINSHGTRKPVFSERSPTIDSDKLEELNRLIDEL